jgi:hypothetical protein
MMKSEKPRFDPEHHTAERLAKDRSFVARAKLREALGSHLELARPAWVADNAQAAGLLAQQLAFVPLVKSGWGPYPHEIQVVAENLVECYMRHVEAFTCAGFMAPSQAALEALKGFDFAV